MKPWLADPDVTLYLGDCLETLRSLPDGSVQCCVTSPPYWGLRDYGTGRWDGGDPDCDHKTGRKARNDGDRNGDDGFAGNRNMQGHADMGDLLYREECGKCGARRVDRQLGLEQTPDEYVAGMVAVFGEVRRVLRDDGTLWLNLGDSYNAGRDGGHAGGRGSLNAGRDLDVIYQGRSGANVTTLKPKDLVGIPWRVAFALQADGWYLRSDIIWAKPNPMPESVKDRPTKSHEYVFLLSKGPRYFYDAAAIAEPATWYGPNGHPKSGPHAEQGGIHKRVGKNEHTNDRRKVGFNERWDAQDGAHPLTRNARSVWEIQTQQFADAHFAVFPMELPRRCILAGSRPGDVVLDPFAGSGTTLLVARNHERRSVGIELNETYCDLIATRLQQLSLLTGDAA